MSGQRFFTILLLLLVAFSSADRRAHAGESASDLFERRVRPILIDKCLGCHSAAKGKVKGGLSLDSAAGWKTGGDSGPAIIPGKPEESLIIKAIRYDDPDLRMPPKQKLSASEIAVLTQWVGSGAFDPRSTAPASSTGPRAVDLAAGRNFWAFKPPVSPALPKVENKTWSKTPVDLFILAELESRALRPVAPADKRTLIRRATLDLTGLPPTPEEVFAFLSDKTPNAFAKVVDRLLASPQYGERWGRHWLDVARYADSNGLDENVAHGNAWRYRDYVVRAFNSDKPFDQFLTEQLAGDLLAPSVSESVRRERRIATGFLVLGPKVLAEVDETKMEMDIVDEQIDTVGKAFLGLTLGCARCHDHKFDPISTEDYYGLAGIFRATKTMESFKKVARWHEFPIAEAQDLKRLEEHKARIAAKQQEITEISRKEKERLVAAKAKNVSESAFSPAVIAELKKRRAEVTALEKNPPDVPSAMGVGDSPAKDVRVHIRGSHLSLGPAVPRRVPLVLVSQSRPAFPTDHSGRLELARWMTRSDHPLTARVIVNRVWRWHFGRGIVGSADNFGLLGERPSHPALLDWLAVRFVESGWSIKDLHRLIMLSSVYQLSSAPDEKGREIDPENRLLWHFRPRRLEAEAIRDSLLHVSGRLDTALGGSLLNVKNRDYFFDHTSKDKASYDSTRRSIYLPVVRNHLYDGFDLFDYNDAGVSTGDRATTTVAPQALFLLNSDLVVNSAGGLAERVIKHSADDRARLSDLFETCLGRPATEPEIAASLRFLREARGMISDKSPASAERRAWQALAQTLLMSNEFIYID